MFQKMVVLMCAVRAHDKNFNIKKTKKKTQYALKKVQIFVQDLIIFIYNIFNIRS